MNISDIRIAIRQRVEDGNLTVMDSGKKLISSKVSSLREEWVNGLKRFLG